MKVVFVLGFYDPVKTALDSLYSERIRDGSIVWIGQKARGMEANLTEFSAVFSKHIQAGAAPVLVLVAQIRGRDFVVDAVRGIMHGAGSSEQPVPFENAADRDGVLEYIASFGLEPPGALSCERIRAKTPKGKILCVSLDTSTSVVDALKRAGFPADAIPIFFEEERIPHGRNSGLMEYLASRSRQFAYLLYAFHGLRTLTPEVKGKFEKCYEAPTAAKIAELARKWIEGS